MSDLPFKECVKAADAAIAKGFHVYQKFTCSNCGNRLTMQEPDKFWLKGSCDKCFALTDIEAAGCGFLMHAVIR